MKIVFISIGAYPYVSEWGYQDNELNKAAVKAGDSVTQISTSYVPGFLKNYIQKTPDFMSSVYKDQYGVNIIRLNYKLPWLGRLINSRLRWYKDLYKILEAEKPDIIFVHDLNEWSLFDITRYLRNHPECKGCADLHATYENSCRNALSKWLQHRMFYRFIIQRNIEYFTKIFYLTKDALFFCETEYALQIPENKKEFLPIGGIVSEPEMRKQIRETILKELGLDKDTILILHSGKLEREKRTADLIEAVRQIKSSKIQLVIIGRIAESYEEELLKKIKEDSRIHFLGWKTSDELRNYMMASDLYAQPGTESASLNNAICCGCPVMLSPQEQNCGGYRSYLDEDKVFFIDTVQDMVNVIQNITENPELLDTYRKYSYDYAYHLLDYDRQIERIKMIWGEQNHL